MATTRKLVFHEDHSVSIDGYMVGTWHSPEPSIPAVWAFKANDGRVSYAATRNELAEHAANAFRRLPILIKLEPLYPERQ